jgi:3-hydroxyisobutyrate dehydrogenase-like beta-hydroxyacid dehydrogenase
MIGRAEPDDSDEISKLLIETISMMGSPEKFLFCGRLGAGLTAKITNNYLAGVNLLAIAEAMAFGIRSGVDKHILYKVIKNSSGQSWMCDHVNPVPGVLPNVPSSRDYQGGFKAQMMVKDMSLGVGAGKAMGVRTTTGSAALEVYKESAVDPRCVVSPRSKSFAADEELN